LFFKTICWPTFRIGMMTAADQAIASCGGDLRATIEALIIANHLLETDHHLSFIYVANPILMP